MSQEVKYGAIWNLNLDKGDTIISERHLIDYDLVSLIVEQSCGFLLASVWRKELDEQSGSTMWIIAGGDPCQCATRDEAEAYLESTVRLIGDQHQ